MKLLMILKSTGGKSGIKMGMIYVFVFVTMITVTVEWVCLGGQNLILSLWGVWWIPPFGQCKVTGVLVCIALVLFCTSLAWRVNFTTERTCIGEILTVSSAETSSSNIYVLKETVSLRWMDLGWDRDREIDRGHNERRTDGTWTSVIFHQFPLYPFLYL